MVQIVLFEIAKNAPELNQAAKTPRLNLNTVKILCVRLDK